jgi:hypothetical protein
MATRYPLNTIQSVGLYTSGGGAAGLVGALTYTILTQLGASPSAVISGTGFVPLIIVLLYNFWLPPFPPIEKEVKKPGQRKEAMIKDLGTKAKLSLAKPMLPGYMLPLCALFLIELTNVQVRFTQTAHFLVVANNSIFRESWLPSSSTFPSPETTSHIPRYSTASSQQGDRSTPSIRLYIKWQPS